MTNQTFVTEASSSNNFEVAAGALAQSKGQNQAVRHYGEHMVTDHSVAAMEMGTLASRKGWNIMPSGDMLSKRRQQLDMLTAATGTDFDKKFAEAMVQSHQEAVSLFERASSTNGVPDDDLRALATMKLPTLKTHLQDAMTLRTTVNP
ncbi:MAG: DUF4142 domain-containing protein [Sphingobacteriales bacterium]|nr:MAG: DUF4142 domain-containing protein [Sphingobacteriales bacterium]